MIEKALAMAMKDPEEPGLSREEHQHILLNRIREAETEISMLTGYYPTLSENRRAILLYLAYKLGIPSLMEMRPFLADLADHNYEAAAKSLLDSYEAKKNPALFERLAYCIEFDKM